MQRTDTKSNPQTVYLLNIEDPQPESYKDGEWITIPMMVVGAAEAALSFVKFVHIVGVLIGGSLAFSGLFQFAFMEKK